MDDVTRSLVLALGVCYYASLKKRKEYRETIAKYFTKPLHLPRGADHIKEEISRCQSIFLDNVELDDNIAKNQALKENVFRMVVCIELRIPMFLVGKPGSSKSLAKTIVADAMQGNSAHIDLFKNYKQVQMLSLQCSTQSTPEGIVGTFRQSAAYQKDKTMDRFVSIVVLDEIGLAEDSPKMPLNSLYHLLEDGCLDDEEPATYKKVAFIGISNRALDPAKTNRGILVQTQVPNEQELIESAENFGGLENVYPVEIFCSKLRCLIDQDKVPMDTDPDCSSAGLIKACLRDIYYNPNRYLLLLTENYGALTILQQEILDKQYAVVLFGSSFPGDQEYTQHIHFSADESKYIHKLMTIAQLCFIIGSVMPLEDVYRNINRIKVCMEFGCTVILLNLENLYESLYDALNQYYVYFGGERYVDLGNQRVRCRVHKAFRLIIVAEKQTVYNRFPITLINRLEKHFLSLKTILTSSQLELAEKLQHWAKHFCDVKVPAHLTQKQNTDRRRIGDAFVGYHDDTCAAIILHVCQEKKCDGLAVLEIENEILVAGQSVLLWCATPEAVLQLNNADIIHTYFREQHHESLAGYLQFKIVSVQQKNLYTQVTTNSKLLSSADIEILCRFIPIQKQNVTLLSLQSFDTEQQFWLQIRSCFDQSTKADMLMIVQCDCGDQNADLIACARYNVQRVLERVQGERTNAIHVVFLIQLPGIAGGCFTGFQCGLWHSVHIDDIHPAPEDIPFVAEMHGENQCIIGLSKRLR